MKCLPVTCDVTDTNQIEEAVKAVTDKFGTVDILVNNAGGALVRQLKNYLKKRGIKSLPLI